MRIGIPLFNIFLNEADEQSRRLTTEVAEWAMELHRPVGETPIALAHSLAGSSATVGYADLSHLARALEHALMRIAGHRPWHAEEAVVRRHGRRDSPPAASVRGRLPEGADAGLLQRLADHEMTSPQRLGAGAAPTDATDGGRRQPVGRHNVPTPAAADRVTPRGPVEPMRSTPSGLPAADQSSRHAPAVAAPMLPSDEHTRCRALRPRTRPGRIEAIHRAAVEAMRAEPVRRRRRRIDSDDDIDAVDAVDAELFPIFEEEARNCCPSSSRAARWARRPERDRARVGVHAHAAHAQGRRPPGRRDAPGRDGAPPRNRDRAAARPRPTPSADDVEASARPRRCARHTFEVLRRASSGLCRGHAAAHAKATARGRSPCACADAAAGAAWSESSRRPRRVSAVAESVAETAAERSEPLPSRPAPAAHSPARGAAGRLPRSTGRASAAAGDAGAVYGRADRTARSASRRCACVRRCSTAWSTRPARCRSRARASKPMSAQIKSSLGDLTDNLERLRHQLRDIELQAETQMTSRMEAAKAAAAIVRPARVRPLHAVPGTDAHDGRVGERRGHRAAHLAAHAAKSTEDELAAQARLTRDLQDDLLRTRMVEFEGLSDRLYRVVRQAAKETGKHVRLDIVGGSIEVDRGVLDRMTGAFEHLLRNSVTHGIESPERARRRRQGCRPARSSCAVATRATKSASSSATTAPGLNLPRIREKGRRDGPARCRAKPYSDARTRQPHLHPRLLHRRNGDRACGPRHRHGRGARRSQRDGRPHRDRHRRRGRARASSSCCR